MDPPTAFEWDDAEADGDLAKHKITSSTAIAIFADPHAVVVDTVRAADGEVRQKAIGQIQGKLFIVVYAMRGDACRLISACRANTSEERAYGTRDARP